MEINLGAMWEGVSKAGGEGTALNAGALWMALGQGVGEMADRS